MPRSRKRRPRRRNRPPTRPPQFPPGSVTPRRGDRRLGGFRGRRPSGLPRRRWRLGGLRRASGRRRWSRAGGCRGVTIVMSGPSASRSAAASRPEATTPSMPASFAWRARASTSSSTVPHQPSSRMLASSMLVSTVMARQAGCGLVPAPAGGFHDAPVAVDRQQVGAERPPRRARRSPPSGRYRRPWRRGNSRQPSAMSSRASSMPPI